MNASDDIQDDISRRSFLLSGSGFLTSMWVAAQWPAIAAAAQHADQVPDAAPAHFEFFSAADGADVEAISAQIVPSGATSGAREAHAVFFIDRSLSTYFASMAPDYRLGLADFQSKFLTANSGVASFAAAGSDQQIAILKTVDRTPFFEITRMLTVLGMFSSPKYGGNFQGSGWKMLGFVDQHAFTPPFGYYDAEYEGFVPYPAEKHA